MASRENKLLIKRTHLKVKNKVCPRKKMNGILTQKFSFNKKLKFKNLVPEWKKINPIIKFNGYHQSLQQGHMKYKNLKLPGLRLSVKKTKKIENFGNSYPANDDEILPSSTNEMAEGTWAQRYKQ